MTVFKGWEAKLGQKRISKMAGPNVDFTGIEGENHSFSLGFPQETQWEKIRIVAAALTIIGVKEVNQVVADYPLINCTLEMEHLCDPKKIGEVLASNGFSLTSSQEK